MLWSLTKILTFMVALTAITFGASFLMEAQGGVTIEYGGIELNLKPLQATLLMVFLLISVWFLLKLMGLLIAVAHFINGDETALSRYFDRNRERRGFEALSSGLMALASGDDREAMAGARKAGRLLNRPNLTNLVLAQAAVASGDKKTATETYKTLLQDPETRFVGIHGLLKQKLQEKDFETALNLATRAFALKPTHLETQDALLKLQAGQKDWAGVRKILNTKLQHGSLPRDVHRRRDSVFALSQARELRAAGQLDAAHVKAVESNKLTPGLVPAAILTAQGYLEKGKPKLASKTLCAAWSIEPHPELAASFATIVFNETPTKRMDRFLTLTKLVPSHSENKMVLAELNIAAGQFGQARLEMGDLASVDPTMRSLTIMAAIERGEGGDDQSIREILAEALSAQRDPQWVCDNCGHISHEWEPVCVNCETIDSVSWKRPPKSDAVSPQMLPLIIGQTVPDEKYLVGKETD